MTERAGPADLHGQLAIVTGAARGIGAAIAVALARVGAHLVLADLQPCAGTVERIQAAGGTASTVTLDLADRAAVRSAVGQVVDEHGRIDVLVNNAGIVSTSRLPDLTESEWDRVLAVNLTAALVTTQAAWATLVRHQGRVVYVTSRAARTGGNNAGPAYVASKGALQALTISAANEGAPHGVRVNAVMPGPIATDMTALPSYADPSKATPLGRMGTPEDIAEAVVFLASSASAFVTGTVLNVTGGLLPG